MYNEIMKKKNQGGDDLEMGSLKPSTKFEISKSRL